MTLKVFFDVMSQPSRAVLILLRCTKIPHEEKPVALRRAEHLQEAYKKINPFSTVPVIVDDDFRLTESGAIMRYLCNKHLVGTPQEHWYPSDLQKRARVDEYLCYHHLNTRLNCAQYFRHRFMFPITKQKAPNPKEIEKLRKGIDATLDSINNYFLDNRPFFLGDKISIADLQGTCEIEQLLAAGVKIEDGHKEVMEWMQRVRDATSPHYGETSKIVYQIAAKLKALIKAQEMDSGVAD